jgi:hypothetical protein
LCILIRFSEQEDTILPFALPTVGRKKVVAAFDGGRLTSDGGVVLLSLAEQRLKVAERLAAAIADHRDPARVLHPLWPTYCAPAF